jgi:hypothetical protein
MTIDVDADYENGVLKRKQPVTCRIRRGARDDSTGPNRRLLSAAVCVSFARRSTGRASPLSAVTKSGMKWLASWRVATGFVKLTFVDAGVLMSVGNRLGCRCRDRAA